MTTPDDKAYEAQLSELLDAIADFRRRQQAAEAAYQTSIGFASEAEQRAKEAVASAAELIDRSLRNARQAVAGLVPDTLIPPRMLASTNEANVGHADVDEALAQVNREVIDLRGLADRVRAGQSVSPVAPVRTPPPMSPGSSARSPLWLAIGLMLGVATILYLVLAIPR